MDKFIKSSGKQVRFTLEEAKSHKGLRQFTCQVCSTKFALRACRVKKNNNAYCSSDCYNKTLHKKTKVLSNKTFKRRFFAAHKEEYKDKIIDYPNSPTGKAYVGINKSPLMPAVENGYGFQGVLLQDDNRELVQCHACGMWVRKLANFHLKQCCGLTAKEYKDKYGLNSDGGLVSDETSLRLTKACLKNKKNINEKFTGKSGKGGTRKGHSLAYFNKYGTCPLQLKTRLYEFIRCNRELPSQGNKGRPLYKALRRRFGSYSHALTAHGLPFMKRQGTTYRFSFSDGTIYKYNINQFYDRELLYKMMIEKCPVLQSSPSL